MQIPAVPPIMTARRRTATRPSELFTKGAEEEKVIYTREEYPMDKNPFYDTDDMREKVSSTRRQRLRRKRKESKSEEYPMEDDPPSDAEEMCDKPSSTRRRRRRRV